MQCSSVEPVFVWIDFNISISVVVRMLCNMAFTAMARECKLMVFPSIWSMNRCPYRKVVNYHPKDNLRFASIPRNGVRYCIPGKWATGTENPVP